MENSNCEFSTLPSALGNPAEGAGFPNSPRVGGNYFPVPEPLSGSASSHSLTDADRFGHHFVGQRRCAPSSTIILRRKHRSRSIRNTYYDQIGIANHNHRNLQFPQNRGRNKYFPVVQASGEIEEEIIKSILRAYKKDDK